MLHRPCLFAGLCLLAVSISPAEGGIYNPAESAEGILSTDFRAFQNGLIEIKGMASDLVHTPRRKRALLAATLMGRTPPAHLTADQALSLSAYLLRLNRPTEAVALLRPLVGRERDNFLLLCNLATAFHMIGEHQQAVDYLDIALSRWPCGWHRLSKERQNYLLGLGWSEAQYGWYREVETWFLKLLRLRQAEAGRKRPRWAEPESLDALFDDGKSPPQPLRFVGPSGQYEPGQLAPAEQAKLPRNSLEITQQLLLWLPHDQRLYFLLGELFNARGDVVSALKIFEDLARTEARLAGLREHRQILHAHLAANPLPESTQPPSDNGKKKDDRTGKNGSEDGGSWPGFWRTLGVGFLAGMLFAFFGYWQIREILRRRQLRKPQPNHVPPT